MTLKSVHVHTFGEKPKNGPIWHVLFFPYPTLADFIIFDLASLGHRLILILAPR